MKKQYLFYLDFIRCFSCCVILLFHFARITTNYNITGFPKLDLFANGDWGFIAVVLFFMLSGYALMYIYQNKKLELKNFYKKRFKSIYPYFWICYLLVFIYYIITTGTVANYLEIQNNPIKIIIGSVLTIFGLDGYLSYTFYLIGEWFLPCIIVLYIVFPLFKKCLEKYDKLFLLCLTILYFLVLVFERYSPILIHRNILVCGYQFILGMYMCKYKINIKNFLYVLLAIISFCCLLVFKINIYSSLIVTIMGLLLFLILMFFGCKIKNMMFQKLVHYISEKSFLIFLIHHVVFDEVLKYYSNLELSIIESFLLFALCITIILVLSIIVEKIYYIVLYWKGIYYDKKIN